MKIRVFIAALLGSLIFFGWGFFIWANSGLPFLVIQAVPNEDQAVKALQDNLSKPGVYRYPWWTETKGTEAEKKAAMDLVVEKSKKGPLLTVIYRPDGVDIMNPIVYAFGFGQMFASALLVAMLLALAAPALTSYWSRLFFIILAGLFASVSVSLSDPIWFHQPWNYPLFSAAYHWLGWVPASLVMALVVKVPTARDTSADAVE